MKNTRVLDQRIKILPNGDAVREYVEPVFKAYDMTDPAQAKIALHEDLRAILNLSLPRIHVKRPPT